MCFSAEVSLATSAALLPAGAYCCNRATRHDVAYLPLALIPFLFGLQQLAEGIVWIGFGGQRTDLVRAGALAYLAFSHVLWPMWVPWAVRRVVSGPRVRLCLGVLLAVGIALAFVLYLPLVAGADASVDVSVRGGSIRYDTGALPIFAYVASHWIDAAYVLVVIAPFALAAPDRGLLVFGALLVVSVTISLHAYWYAFISVWCFAAALMSLQLCVICHRLGRASDESRSSRPFSRTAGWSRAQWSGR